MKKRKNSILFSIVLLFSFIIMGCGADNDEDQAEEISVESAQDGSYETTGKGKNGDILVLTMIEAGRIAEVKVLEHKETDEYAEEPLQIIPARMVEENTVHVDTVSGATMTSKGIIEAVKQAVKAAQ